MSRVSASIAFVYTNALLAKPFRSHSAYFNDYQALFGSLFCISNDNIYQISGLEPVVYGRFSIAGDPAYI